MTYHKIYWNIYTSAIKFEMKPTADSIFAYI